MLERISGEKILSFKSSGFSSGLTFLPLWDRKHLLDPENAIDSGSKSNEEFNDVDWGTFPRSRILLVTSARRRQGTSDAISNIAVGACGDCSVSEGMLFMGESWLWIRFINFHCGV